jgi:hypothetical protein
VTRELSWEPRDRSVAGRLCAGLTGFAALAQLSYALVTPQTTDMVGRTLSYGLPGALIVLTLVLWRVSALAPPITWTIVPLLGLVSRSFRHWSSWWWCVAGG